MTLRSRFAAISSLSVALAVVAAAIALYMAVRSDLRGEIDKALRLRAQGQLLVSGGAGARGLDRSLPAGPPSPPGSPAGSGGSFGAPQLPGFRSFPGSVVPAPFGAPTPYVEFITKAGRVAVPGGQGPAPRPIALTASDRAIAARGAGSSLGDRTVSGISLRVLTVGAGSAGGAVLVARSLTEAEHELSHLLLILVLIGAGGIVLAALLGTLVARTALGPIARFTRSTESLSGSLGLSERLEVRGRDELARLAESFNATLDALERSVAAQRHLIADASHELRTPISSLRTNIQVLAEAERLPPEELADLRRDLVEELDELTALVGDVVELARGAGAPGPREDVRLDEIAEDAVQRARRRGDVRFELSLEPTLVCGQPDRISRAVSNLIDNARKWSPAGGCVEVSLADGVLAVRDHGPGFQESDLPFVFDRFYRADDARKLPGSGLGLAIVRQAAESCGGFAEAANAEGQGALLRVSFGAPLDVSGALRAVSSAETSQAREMPGVTGSEDPRARAR